MNILLVEDNVKLSNILKLYLEKENFNVVTAYDGEQALELYYENHFSLVILDWMLPKIDGIEVLKEIKRDRGTKVLMLTAKSLEEDELLSLTTGADDFLRKPFNPKILMIRVKKMLNVTEDIVIDGITINLESLMVYKNQEYIKLSSKELDLLLFLVRNRGMTFSRIDLLYKVWGEDYEGDSRVVDTNIKRLREKLSYELITTVRGVGYVIEK